MTLKTTTNTGKNQKNLKKRGEDIVGATKHQNQKFFAANFIYDL